MISRLDRLFLLLDSGTSMVIKKSAAAQLGEVQKQHPNDLQNLLSKLRTYLHSPNWDTRIAAGYAIEKIISNVPQWNPPGITVDEQSESDVKIFGGLKFSDFNIQKVMESGVDLLASDGKQYDYEEIKDLNDKDRISYQRHLLNKRLGLDLINSHLIEDTDLNQFVEPSPTKAEKDISEVINSFPEHPYVSQKLKRKKSCSQVFSEEPLEKKIKLEEPPSDCESENQNQEWPLKSFSELLMNDLFSPVWEIRHGAATALREIVKHHGAGAGRTTDLPSHLMDQANQLWLKDLALRLISVLALDKLGDYISDQVVAPVRETVAQALGLTASFMDNASLVEMLNLILKLLQRPEWEARHGGMLGLKYCLAIRKDMNKELVPIVYESIFRGLQDREDDVSAVAAAALLPIADCLVDILPEEVPKVVSCLWDALLELDDLTASTNSIVKLLASLLSYPISFVEQNDKSLLKQLIPRLWPFFEHPSDIVRKSVVHALAMFSKNDLFKTECLPAVLSEALRLLFQQCLVETKKEILELIYKVWTDFIESSSLVTLINATNPYIAAWLCFTMHPERMPLDSNLGSAWLHVSKWKTEKANSRQGNRKCSKDIVQANAQNTTDEMGNFCIGGKDLVGEMPEVREALALQSRTMCSRLLAVLFHQLYNANPSELEADVLATLKADLASLLVFHLNSKSALQRFIISLIITSWAHLDKGTSCPDVIKNKLLDCLTDFIYFDELALEFFRTQKDFQDFISTCKHYKLKIELEPGAGATLEQMKDFTENISSILKAANLKSKLLMELENKRQYLLKMIAGTSMTHETWSVKVHSTIAGALIALKQLPEKLTPLVRPLMDAIKKERNASLQQATAEHLVYLMEECLGRSPCPNDKITRNLVTLVCTGTSASLSKCDAHNDNVILTLLNMQKNAERQCFRRANSVGRPPRIPEGVILQEDKEEKQAAEIQQKGASLALTTAALHFGPKLFQHLPQLRSSTFDALLKHTKPLLFNGDKSKGEDNTDWELVTSLRTLEIVSPFLHPELHSQLVEVLDQVAHCLELPSPEVRHHAARTLGMASKVVPVPTMSLVLSRVLPNLDASSTNKRLGAIEGLACIVEELEIGVVPYLASLIVPLLGRMSDPLIPIRLLSTHCFASLVRLIPLEAGKRKHLNETDFPLEMAECLNRERDFLDQLLDPSKLEPFSLPPGLISAELRPYQQQGVNWLAFLKRYRLHGVLCDDMGLGKTLQSLCMLASDHHIKESNGGKCQQSLVICPPTLTGHWIYEVKKFIKPGCFNPLHYVGTPLERIKLREKAKGHNLIIASYDIVRNDIDFFESITWNFCILDEGHIIKNGKTKVSKALKQLKINHRIILTGTPIQNNVLELWSLFDFLMPGFLGTEKEFIVHYSRPILQSRDAKASTKEQEAGALAMESLHRQVLPFLLRRKKEDVLKDLPPKIIQDFYCDLSPLQIRLYEDFSASQAKNDILQHNHNSDSKSRKDPHVFEALQYLRNVCNHPKLVLKPSHPEYRNIIEDLKSQNSSLSEIDHAAKLMALKQLLQDCGICSDNTESVINQHRVLIFCQLKSMLDIIENDLFKKHMPKLSYLRLDGSVPQGSRIEVAEQFNHDPSIDVFLLTTHIGGLGLNLTGADTVIFVEHDWNPMKDFQAMDRAHRIGQKKVVNIYRLITRGTLEEKIMGLQEFKMKIANTVISTDNSQLQSMATGDLLDLFTFSSTSSQGKTLSKESSNSGLTSLLKELPELWSTEQYDAEYDLANFLSLLQHKKK